MSCLRESLEARTDGRPDRQSRAPGCERDARRVERRLDQCIASHESNVCMYTLDAGAAAFNGRTTASAPTARVERGSWHYADALVWYEYTHMDNQVPYTPHDAVQFKSPTPRSVVAADLPASDQSGRMYRGLEATLQSTKTRSGCAPRCSSPPTCGSSPPPRAA